MTVTAFRFQNFMAFEDSGWIEFSNINLLFGNNSAGKSAIIRALLLLQQSVSTWHPTDIDGRQSKRQDSLIFSQPDGHDLGSFYELVREHDIHQTITFGFRHKFPLDKNPTSLRYFDGFESTLKLLGILPSDFDPDVYRTEVITLDTELSFRQVEVPGCGTQVILCGLGLYRTEDSWHILEAELDVETDTWIFDSSTFDNEKHGPLWQELRFKTSDSFFPYLTDHDDHLSQPSRSAYGLEAGFVAYQHIEINELTNDISSGIVPKDVSDTVVALQLLLNFVLRDDVHRLISFSYLGPVRPRPSRYIRVTSRPAIVNSPTSEDMLRLWLDAESNPEIKARLELLNIWLRKSFGIDFYFNPIDNLKQLYECLIVHRSGGESNLAEVGFGISQLLPILIHAASEDSARMLVIEQPELHLHPGGQVKLADLFTMLSQHGVTVLLETHSEHLLLRLQTRVAQATAGQINSETNNLFLAPDELHIFFVHRDSDGTSTCNRIDVGQFGDLLNTPSGFEDFFSDDLFESATRARIRLTA